MPKKSRFIPERSVDGKPHADNRKHTASEPAAAPRFFEFSVIAGDLKGKIIRAPDLGITRPPLSRLRKSIFDFLVPYLPDARYLDLFSGTGSYLFEAVSRGVGKAVGIERDPQLANAINEQAKRFAVDDRLRCQCNDVFALVPQLAQQGETFDIIMMAPPQYLGLVNQTLKVLRTHPTLCEGALILCQTDTSEVPHLRTDGFTLQQARKYGNTTYTVVTLAEPEIPEK